jgi:hypothetical protein
MFDEEFDGALQEWVDDYALWKAEKHPDQQNCPFWEWAGRPPDPNYYRSAFLEEPTWYQVYETVSEGTPVSPPFAIKDELIDYLVKNGDFWDQRRGHGAWSRENAAHFVENEGYRPSGMLIISPGGTREFIAAKDMLPSKKSKKE